MGAVLLDAAEGTLGLDGAVHEQKSTVDAVEVGKDLLMEAEQLFIQADGAATLGLGAFVLVRTVGTILSLIEFLNSTVVVALGTK